MRRWRGRYDYEGVASEGAEAMMDHLRSGPAQPGDDMGSGFELEGREEQADVYGHQCFVCADSFSSIDCVRFRGVALRCVERRVGVGNT